MMKKIMNNAWKIAKGAANKFGGKAIEYIAGALKMAWAMAKGLSEKTIKALERKGFNRWAKCDKDRLYFDLEKRVCWKSIATEWSHQLLRISGEEISHSLASKLLGVKSWIDVQTGKLYSSKAYDEGNKDIVVALAKKALQSI
ncbi:hypothetical protein CU5_27 [Lactobacillus phage phiPYB5]|uniref:hypothetical protein n=1 Tax=Lactobacillus phage phiPYB5 TaxID=438780 RepID=UPI0001C0AD91|nr:hypothetical protein APL49_gp27 [Lactobacillus phage phiPYB5]ADA79905.1 hypothetical protein CU5_27 [Lactobacillus phage phiPYB5]